MADFVILTKPDCKYCNEAKKLLTEKGQTFDEFSVENPSQLRDFMLAMGLKTVPQIWTTHVDDHHGPHFIGDYTDLLNLEWDGE